MSSDGPPPGVIVAGMHRSATSLTASTLIGCGWHQPGQVYGAERGNERGLYEDRRVYELHAAVLRHYRAGWAGLRAGRLRGLRRQDLSFDTVRDELAAVVSELRSGAPWIWKNPRATLFLAAWASALPEATFVICVRSPAAVADSLMRRDDDLGSGRVRALAPAKALAKGLSLWHSYNSVAYRFATRHPERAVILRVPDDLPTLAAATDPQLFDPGLFTEQARLPVRAAATLTIRSGLLYRRLRRLHDPRRLAALLAGPPT